MDNQLDSSIVALTKAIGKSESSGNYAAQGKSGEYGAYQYTKPTWEADSQKYLGQVVPLEQATPAQQDEVAYKKVSDLGKQGYNPAQIASIWNSGKPQWEGNVGVNKYGVKYDTPAYVKNVAKAYEAELNNQSSVTNLPAGQQPAVEFKPNYPTPVLDANSKITQSDSWGNDMANRATYAGNALLDTANGKINPLSGLLHVSGAIGGAIGDTVSDIAGAVTPDWIKDPIKNAIGNAVGTVANTGVGQSAIKGYENFSQEHPEVASDINDVGNIATAIPIVKGLSAVKSGVGGLIGKALGRDALSNTIEDISPEIKAGTKAGAKNVASKGTTQSGITGTINRVEDPIWREAAGTVQEVAPKFDSIKTYSEKVNTLQDGIENLANQLRDNLKKEAVQPILHQDNYGQFIAEVNKQIAESPSLVGDSGEYAKRFLQSFQNYLPKDRYITMTDILDARQKLDIDAKKYKPTAFDKQGAFNDGLTAVRNSANNLLDREAPNAQVKALLRKQSLLYKVIGNLSSRADKEVGTSRLGRMAQRHPLMVGLVKGAGKYAAEGAGFGAVAGGAGYLMGKD